MFFFNNGATVNNRIEFKKIIIGYISSRNTWDYTM